MQITFSPIRRDETLTLGKQGDTLTVNGEAFDFSPLPDGADLPGEAINSEWLLGAKREGGELHITVLLPHGGNAPEETRFPQPITVTADGPVPVPEHSIPEPEPEQPA